MEIGTNRRSLGLVTSVADRGKRVQNETWNCGCHLWMVRNLSSPLLLHFTFTEVQHAHSRAAALRGTTLWLNHRIPGKCWPSWVGNLPRKLLNLTIILTCFSKGIGMCHKVVKARTTLMAYCHQSLAALSRIIKQLCYQALDMTSIRCGHGLVHLTWEYRKC